MPSDVRVRCPGCQAVLRIPGDALDQPIRCQKCQKRFRAAAKPKTAAAPPRLLVVNVSNSLSANPPSPRCALEPNRTATDTAALVKFLGDRLHVSKAQRYHVSDATDDPEARPPLKSVIMPAVEHFLATCRPQDRVLVMFVGHALDVEDQPYLVPLEGELTAKETLIPLQWLYDRLAACPARQKGLLLDLLRHD